MSWRGFLYGIITGVFISVLVALVMNQDSQPTGLNSDYERKMDSLRTVYQNEIKYLSKEADSLYLLVETKDTIIIRIKENETIHLNNVDSLPYDSLVSAIRFSLLHD